MDLDSLILLAAAGLLAGVKGTHNDSTEDQRKTAVREARMLWQEVLKAEEWVN